MIAENVEKTLYRSHVARGNAATDAPASSFSCCILFLYLTLERPHLRYHARAWER